MYNQKFIRRFILSIIAKNDGHCDWNIIRTEIGSYYFAKRISVPTDKQITHVAYLLEKDGAVERLVESPYINYRITPWGHAIINSWYQKLIYFLMYKNHNLFSILAFLISIVAIVLSDRVWNFINFILTKF